MITVSTHAETGDVEILYDDETMQGNQIGMRIEDDLGMGLLADLCAFYEAKGYKPILHLLNAKKQVEQAERLTIGKRIARLFGGITR